MKKLLSLFAAAFMLLTAGCSQAADETAKPNNDSIVLPPSRVGEGTFEAVLARKYTFETAFSEADVVARIKVGNWLYEDTENDATYFDAKVLQCFKGDIPENFTLYQSGSSHETLEGFPLFTYGKELLLFLNQGTVPGDEQLYWIIGSFTTVINVSYDNDGNRYYAASNGILGESVNISSNYANQSDIAQEVYNYTINSDPFLADMTGMQYYPYIFSESDVNALIDSLKMS
ncbi:MAG: hypothetical protein K2K41_07295 [Ruminiclostridium sp.]|nr:hypothetical protein [Ruminiclostridium sp.]MDE6725135.1 hypothetical protein [Ruminiclostridium sp.]